MNQLFKSFLTLFVVAVSLISCDKEEEAIPSYLHITHFTLSTNPVSEGLNTSEIVGAKVFVNGSEIGNFEIPVTIPVIASGKCIVEVYPNIKENGVGSNQKYYKVYNSFLDTVDLEPKQIDTIRPKTTYRSNVKFVWMEDFEDQAVSMVETGLDNTQDSMVVIPTSNVGVDQPFTGSDYCAYVSIPEDTSVIFERSTLDYFTLPNLGSDVYVELDIKSNMQVQVGVYTKDNTQIIQSPVMVVNSTDGNWRKIYVNLKPEIGDIGSGTKVRVFFATYKEAGDTKDYYFYLDNLKLLHLE